MTPYHSPAAERNKEPIAEVLAEVLPQSGDILEIASGSGQHITFFAQRFPGLTFHPSDPDPRARLSIESFLRDRHFSNIRPPADIDCVKENWPDMIPDAIVCINMVHISSWEATENLFRWAGKVLVGKAPLVFYGPYWTDRAREPSNLNFDASLRERDPRFGIRETKAMAREAQKNGLTLAKCVDMPAHNLTLVFRPTD